MLYFEWNEKKAARNLRLHGVSFTLACVALEDPFAYEITDQIVDGELRLRTIGMAEGKVAVLVVHTNWDIEEGNEVARIIHARYASPGERSEYERIRAASGGNTAQ